MYKMRCVNSKIWITCIILLYDNGKLRQSKVVTKTVNTDRNDYHSTIERYDNHSKRRWEADMDGYDPFKSQEEPL